MPAVHVTVLDAVGVSTAADLFHGTVAADKTVEIMAMTLCQTTDLGDAQEEVLRVGLFRGVSGGSGGSALVEVPLNGGDSASSLVALGVNTTISTSGTQIGLIGWNIRVPLLWCPIPELRPVVSSTQDPFAFRLMAAPADTVTVSGELFWRELY